MRELADLTGGRTFSATPETLAAEALPALHKEFSSLFTIGYSPKNPSPDGKWRRIQVKLKTGAGRVLRAREGYRAR